MEWLQGVGSHHIPMTTLPLSSVITKEVLSTLVVWPPGNVRLVVVRRLETCLPRLRTSALDNVMVELSRCIVTPRLPGLDKTIRDKIILNFKRKWLVTWALSITLWWTSKDLEPSWNKQYLGLTRCFILHCKTGGNEITMSKFTPENLQNGNSPICSSLLYIHEPFFIGIIFGHFTSHFIRISLLYVCVCVGGVLNWPRIILQMITGFRGITSALFPMCKKKLNVWSVIFMRSLTRSL